MNKKDIKFLARLREELLTQSTDGNRNPRFWGIRQKELIWGMSPDYAEGWAVFDGENCSIVGERNNLQSVLDELFDPDVYGLTEDSFDNCDMESVEDVVSAANKALGVSPPHAPLSLVWYKENHPISKEVLFLTKRACEEHIQKFSHRYQDPWPYVMTAIDCPEYETLLRILSTTDWNELLKEEENESVQVGDVCKYSFGNKNQSCAIVKIVRILDRSEGAAEIRFLDVIKDDTGNGFFEYLLKTSGTMNASLKYLHPIK